MKVKISVKHLQIDKANNAIFIIVALAVIVSVFSLVSAKTLLGESSYQHKALKEKNIAIETLKENITAANTLKKQYDSFESQNPNIISGRGGLDIAEAISAGIDQNGAIQLNGQTVNLSGQDGDNAKIVLDALPSRYDFPALISSVEKVANLNNTPLQSVSGTDDSQSESASNSAAQSSPASIAFSITSQTSYSTLQTFIKSLEHSIRPVDITQLSIKGSSDTMTADIEANTYYQTPLSLKIVQKEVK
jgi:hypothetical protein